MRGASLARTPERLDTRARDPGASHRNDDGRDSDDHEHQQQRLTGDKRDNLTDPSEHRSKETSNVSQEGSKGISSSTAR